MSGAAAVAEPVARRHDPAWRATVLIGAVLVAALTLALGAQSRAPRVAAVALALGVVPVVALVLGPGVVRRLRSIGGRSLVMAIPLAALAFVMLAVAWLDGRRPVLLLTVALLAALAGLVLIGEDLRQRARRAGQRAARSPWQQMTTTERARALPWRAAVGALLVGWAALFGLGVAGPYLAGTDLLRAALLVLFVALAASVLVGVPVVVGAAARGDRDRVAQAREDERLRVAAHLHDSVLQTLALLQRQAGDAAAVTRLARSQERALRAWMAGEAELGAFTLAGALHLTVEEVETEEPGLDVDVTVLGDRPLDEPGRALVAAAREALRNAARHARGAPVVVFAELSSGGAGVYVRDEGAGFSLDGVPTERRGVRDAIVGRMAGVGGEAVVDSQPGEGTEVSLRFGDQLASAGG